ncbi:cobalamin biosynthesis protein [Acetobacteraceae bacterium H6797]|nr:cobalamin biosynthesis protein [Acetobacteraceae bacterium H6797]
MIIAGLGCRHDVTTPQILACIDATLSAHALARGQLSALAVPPLKRAHPALHAAAAALTLPLLVASATAMTEAEPRLFTRSAASEAAAGTPSASEASALAMAGPRARLLGPRHVLGPVTCALAACLAATTEQEP